MNDLAFGATLLSLFVLLASAVYDEATAVPARHFAARPSAVAQSTRPPVQVVASTCACNDTVTARVAAR
jgi:hypothetical protein